MLRVLHVGEYVQGGVATYISTLLEHPNNHDIEDYVICADKNSITTWKVPNNHIQYYHYHRSILQIPFAMLAIHKAIRDIRPDIVYCHSTWAGVFVRLPLFFKNNKFRVIYNAHGWSFLQDIAKWKRSIYAMIEKLLQKNTDIIINVSKYELNAAVKNGINKYNQVVIYSGISPKKNEIDSKIELPKGKLNLLFVGRFDPQKGLDILLESFSLSDRDDLHLTIIGDNIIGGGEIDKKNSRRISFLGWVPHEKIASFYNACDVVIMPSRWEAFGLVAIEAMKYGKTVVVSNRGALPEIIQNNKNGFVFDMDRKDDLLSVINSLDKTKLQTMSERASVDFQNNYIAEKMLMSTYDIYKKVLMK